MLALAVVKKAANMSSIAVSCERKEGDKFVCHYKPVVMEFKLFSYSAGLSLCKGPCPPHHLHKPVSFLIWQEPKQETPVLLFLHQLAIHFPSN